jgi:cell wall-associated NlpC family hydrolase
MPYSSRLWIAPSLIALLATPAMPAAPQAQTSQAGPQAAPSPRSVPLGGPAVEAKLRADVRSWRNVPFKDNGTTRAGIGNSGFVRAIVLSAMGATIPAGYDDQMRTGKLVDRKALTPGDLVFFEGLGVGMFRLSKTVGIYLGKSEVALARKEDGVTIVTLTDPKWDSAFKTARRLSTGDSAPPTFDVATYGADRASLLRDIAKAWSGTLYRAGGTTFSGIGNEEFVREVYGAIYETDLEGEPKQWLSMGRGVSKDKLQPGDIILYDADPLRKLLQMQHAGIYIGNGEFVAAVRGSAVTILKLSDSKWKTAYRAARRIDPDVLARAEAARSVLPIKEETPSAPAAPKPVPHTVTDAELKLREVEQEWHGTPYKLGGNGKSGIDCSAFSREVYKNVYDMELPRTAEEQEQLGRAVSRDDLQPGDLVFFRTQGMGPLFRSRHVGVYLGGGEFAQASGRHGVTISRLDNRYWSKRYHGARRLTF